ncbi:MAG TPA: hypothetical protein VG167_15840 [Verrucomicrobiae bacterium]|nr:hypothetical protein [Verrucomicrobiae bacterium]
MFKAALCLGALLLCLVAHAERFTVVNLTGQSLTNSDGMVWPVGEVGLDVNGTWGSHWDGTAMATNTTAGTVGVVNVRVIYGVGTGYAESGNAGWINYFWLGFSFGFVMRFGGLAARWVRKIIGGGGVNE